MNKIALVLIVGILVLAGCGGGNPLIKEDVQVNTTQRYPDLPPVPPVEELNLETPKYDVPRDVNADPVVKNLSFCIDVPEEERDAEFWAQCGEQPIIPNSNIYRGFNYENWILYIKNINRIKEQLRRYQQRIEEINRQRKEWRKLNAEQENSKE